MIEKEIKKIDLLKNSRFIYNETAPKAAESANNAPSKINEDSDELSNNYEKKADQYSKVQIKGLMTAEQQEKQRNTTWVKVGNKKYTFVGESREESEEKKDKFITLTKRGGNPDIALQIINDKIKEVSKEVKKSVIKNISKYNGEAIAKKLGFGDVQGAIGITTSNAQLEGVITKMGFEPFEAHNIVSVISDGNQSFWLGNKNNIVSQAEFRASQGGGPQIYNKEDYLLKFGTPKERSEILALKNKAQEEEEKKAAQAAADDLF